MATTIELASDFESDRQYTVVGARSSMLISMLENIPYFITCVAS